MIVVLVWLTYASLKSSHMLSKQNPMISEIRERNFFDYQTKLDLTQINFKMAFSVEGYLDYELKDDPRYVKYIVRIYGKRNDTLYQ